MRTSNISDLEHLFNTMMQFGKLMSLQTQQSYEDKAATMLQFSALSFLKDQPKDQPQDTISDLANFLKLSKSSATQLVERLVRLKLVKRVDDMEDRRIIRIVITKDGQREFTKQRTKLIEKMKKIFSKIPKEDVRELIRIHTNLIESLRKEHHG